MKANELKSLKKGYFFSCKIPKPHSHYKMAMTKGFYFPGTRSQARHFLKNGNLGLLNFDDVERVEAMLTDKAMRSVGFNRTDKNLIE